jgi:hypothetical protein
VRCKHRTARKDTLALTKAGGISPTSHHFRHLPSPIQNHAHKDATHQQAGKSLQAEPWMSEGRSSESGSYEAGEIKAIAKTRNKLATKGTI